MPPLPFRGPPVRPGSLPPASAGSVPPLTPGTSVRIADVDQTPHVRAWSMTMRLTTFDFALGPDASGAAVSPVPAAGDSVHVLEPAWDGVVVSVTQGQEAGSGAAFYTVTASNSSVAYAAPAPFGLSDAPDGATTYAWDANSLKVTRSITDSGPSVKGSCVIRQEGLWPGMTFTITSALFGLSAQQFSVSNLTVSWPVNAASPVYSIEFGDPMVTLSAWAAGQAANAPDGSISGTKITDLSVTTPKLAANAVTADKINANAVTAQALEAVLVLVSLLKTAVSGCRIELDSAGFRAYAADGSLLVNIPTDGSPVSFIAQVQATTLTVTGNAELQGTGNSLNKLATLTLQAGQTAPNAAPTLAQGVSAGLTLAATTGWASERSGYYDTAGGADGATSCYVVVQTDGAGSFRVAEFKMSDGSIDRTTSLTGGGLGATSVIRGITRIGADWWIVVLDTAASTLYLKRWTRSTGAIGLGFTSIGADFSGSAVFASSYFSPVTTDGTYVYVIGYASDLTLRVVKYSTAPAKVSTTALSTPTAPPGSTFIMAKDAAYGDDGDGSGGRFVVSLSWYTTGWSLARLYEFTTAGALIANRDWADSGSSSGRGLFWDGTNWRQLNNAASAVQTYSNWDWTTASAVYWVGYAWYDGTGTTHETTIGPRASITMERRHQLSVTTATIPVGGADDPDSVRVYMLPNASAPSAGSFKLQVTDALTSRTLATYNSGGAADGGGTPFVGGTGAVMQSATAGWVLRGDGTVTTSQGIVGVAPITRVYTSGATAWSKPAGLSHIVVECVGGGGAGGGAATNAAGAHSIGGGGGSGGYSRDIIAAASLAASVTATVGAGGTGASGATGGAGADSSFGAVCIGKGGSGGTFAATNALVFSVLGGAGGVAGTGDVAQPGQPGGMGWGGGALANGGVGAPGPWGGGGQGALSLSGTSSQAGTAAAANTGGGGGGSCTTGTGAALAGAAGGSGVVVVTEYYGP